MIPYECYVLAPHRTAEALWNFVNTVVPENRNYLRAFPIPESAEKPTLELKSLQELVDYLEKNPQEAYGLYWDNAKPESPFQAIAFFTRDGGLILGTAELGDNAATSLQQLASLTGAMQGIVTSHERPVQSAADFIGFCQSYGKTKIFNGTLQNP